MDRIRIIKLGQVFWGKLPFLLLCPDLDKVIIEKNHDKIRIKLLFQIYFNLILMLTKFYPDIRHGQAFLGNGHFNCCAEMGELMLIYVRDVS